MDKLDKYSDYSYLVINETNRNVFFIGNTRIFSFFGRVAFVSLFKITLSKLISYKRMNEINFFGEGEVEEGNQGIFNEM